MDAIIELNYVTPPESGEVKEDRPGKYFPDHPEWIRAGPGRQYRIVGYLRQKETPIAGTVTVYPSGEMWLSLDDSGTRFVAFYVAYKIFGEVKGWSFK